MKLLIIIQIILLLHDTIKFFKIKVFRLDLLRLFQIKFYFLEYLMYHAIFTYNVKVKVVLCLLLAPGKFFKKKNFFFIFIRKNSPGSEKNKSFY
jgi:hypothetical protein